VSTESVTALQALSAWLRGDEVVVPRAAVYPPGQSDEQVNQQNHQDFVTSQQDATTSALCELRYPRGFGVLGVNPDGPADRLLKPGDIVKEIDGKAAASPRAFAAVLAAEQPGKAVSVVVIRGGKPTTVSVKLAPPLKGHDGADLGVLVNEKPTCLAPFTVDLGLANQIGGPSAGLMFALGIMDKVGTTDLTGGKFIAGTGTIDAKGNVGAIGGIQLKMIAARDKGASVFLAPAGNCSDVNGAVPDGLQIVKVSTLHGAVQDLLRIQHGESVPSC
ncbi:MAG: Lon-like protease, partial [Pseudonocardiales bacterium]|nr:Lon-like protease [Pseudonocardiales bacterium]